MMKPKTIRNRWQIAAACLVVVLLGLASRRVPGLFPDFLGKYPGDALWALAVYGGWAMVAVAWPAWRIASMAVACAFFVECSQLYHASWIDSIRRTTLGHLILGFTFHPPDFIAYVVGIAVGFFLDRLTHPALHAGKCNSKRVTDDMTDREEKSKADR